ncbi:TPA: glucose 1-dehydrogenase [Candidatus Poribacteria bacterium]|nr:glucose 1-dehydrogenase [Candidatus Poribacteria bacterium]
MNLKGKVALITGGGTGIGREIGLSFAREGAGVVVNYSRSEKEANATAQEIRDLGVPSSAIKADVSQDAQVRAMADKVMEECGRLDILVNCAGTTTFVKMGDLEGLTEEMWDRTLAVNLKGTFFCCRAAVPAMKSSGGGNIINISSIAGPTGIGSSIAYCASKAGVICMTKSLARVLAPEIQVNTIAPGFVDTRWTADWPEFKAMHEEATPMKRVAQPADIAEAALFLVRSDFVTGQVITVDGGKSM